MGGCCGESADKPLPDEANRINPFETNLNTKPTAQQPGPHPNLSWQPEKSSYHLPVIASPPAVYNQFGASQAQFDAGSQLHRETTPMFIGNQAAYGSGIHPPGSPTGFDPGHISMDRPSTPTTISTTANPLNAYSPQPTTHKKQVSLSGRHTVSPPAQVSGFSPPADEGKLSVSIDFGTTFSGVAYGSSRIASGKVQQILNWPGSFETFRKIPTCLLYDEWGKVIAWGIEAKNASPLPGTVKCEWFKLFLEPRALREGTVDPRLPALPPGKAAIDLIVDFLSCLWEYAKQRITEEIGAVADLDSADVWLTVPAAWDARGSQMMRDAAITAGLVRSSRAGDHSWKDRLHVITEPEAAAVHCAYLTELHKLKVSQTFMVADGGGGTVDLAAYRVIGVLQNLDIAEICARSGANCGSIFLDLRFRELIKTLLANHPVHLDAASLAYFQHNFSETEKLAYMGEADDDKMFHFTCFNVDPEDDPSVGLINGELAIPGNLLRREVFDPVVNQVLELIEEQMRKIDQRLDCLLLVGGFSGSEYLFRKVWERFSSRVKVIARPPDCDTATVRGAAQYGLAQRPLVSSIIAPQSYMMKVKLPAEPEDHLKRPAYIRENDAGVSVCDNRLQYLVVKGAILRKGQRLRHKFCKFSQTGQDRAFVATLYTSDTDKIMRYTDEGETIELCNWTVDLSVLPSFQQYAAVPRPNGFYTEFELGLELDSAEVRGVLMHEGQDWGRVVFDFRT
ncbi:actin-like ATPase domain-containing protein [Cristinia sonorae]|uniref:Actin-like ATPase domain-containing protein n=1 Tax=Cristinia sonorae TaxID=1940300 RepID=A0A8K0XQK1_9AGAR|nr:actin-like ATPase domain-containing protein [Cristinia sonorae]